MFVNRKSASKITIMALGMLSFSHSNTSFAGYLILNGNNDSLLTQSPEIAVTEADSNSQALYHILIKNEWPTSLTFPISQHQAELHEQQRIQNNLKESGFGNYRFFWIPDSLYEIFLASYFLDHPGQYFALPYNDQEGVLHCHQPRYPFKSLSQFIEIRKSNRMSFDHYECHADSNSYLVKISNLFESDLPQILTKVREHELDLNHRVKSSFFAANEAFHQFLLENRFDLSSHLSSAELQRLRAILVERLYKSYEGEGGDVLFSPSQFGDAENKLAIPVDETKFTAGHNTMLDDIVLAESDAYLSNEAILFRGTAGFKNYIDYAGKSLSYGVSLFAGLFKDSGRGTDSACAYQYLRASPIFYGVRVSKSRPDQAQEMFSIPPLNGVVRLHAKGEVFHARTMLSQDVEPGTEFQRVRPHVIKAGLVKSNSSKSESELAREITEYIGTHSIIFNNTTELNNQELISRHKKAIENSVN